MYTGAFLAACVLYRDGLVVDFCDGYCICGGGEGQTPKLEQKGSWIQKRICPHDNPRPSLHLGERGSGRMKVKTEALGLQQVRFGVACNASFPLCAELKLCAWGQVPLTNPLLLAGRDSPCHLLTCFPHNGRVLSFSKAPAITLWDSWDSWEDHVRPARSLLCESVLAKQRQRASSWKGC